MIFARELVSPSSPAGATDKFVRISDAATGVSIAPPAGWKRVATSDPEVRFLVEGDDASMLLRVTDLKADAGAQTFGAVRKLTDRLVRSVPQARLVRPPQPVKLGGLAGYLYLYTFPDPATGQLGAHAHYFLFRGHTLVTIVFQTGRADRLVALAPLFDRIGATLRVKPG